MPYALRADNKAGRQIGAKRLAQLGPNLHQPRVIHSLQDPLLYDYSSYIIRRKMRLSGTVYVISALVVFVAQLVEVPSINTWKSAGFYDSSIFFTVTSYPVYATLVAIVCLFYLAVVQTRVFLSFVATLDDHDLRHITILNAGLAYAFRSLATLFKRLWRRFWLVIIVFVTIGVFWFTRILSIVCHCSAAAPCDAGPQASLGQLLCYRSSPADVYRCRIYLIFVPVVRLVSLGIVAFVALVVLTYAVVITYTVSVSLSRFNPVLCDRLIMCHFVGCTRSP